MATTSTSPSTSSTPKIKTRFLIISDTHGRKPEPNPNPGAGDFSQVEISWDEITRRGYTYNNFQEPLAEADVVLHCGDLTKRSRVQEFRDSFDMLRAIRAPLKLVIAGNHDFALHEEYFYHSWGGDPAIVAEVRRIIKNAEADGVRYLTEGVYDFTLANGAQLKVFASQYTPSYGGWAFQYNNGHDFNIPPGIDIAMTHGPPLGVLDVAFLGHLSAGCPDLFRAIQKAKPRIHCFGHIHEAWGALLARWKDVKDEPVCYKTAIDAGTSKELNLNDLMPRSGFSEDAEVNFEKQKLGVVFRINGISVDLTKSPNKLVAGQQTLFLNAATMDRRYVPDQPAWLVDIDLPKAEATDAADVDCEMMDTTP